MKFEDIEVGKTYLASGKERLVKYKKDATKEVVTLKKVTKFLVYDEQEYEHWTELLEEQERISRIAKLIKKLRAECDKQGFDLDVIIKTK